MTYTFEQLASGETLSQFRSRELISVSCSGCQAEVHHTKKAIQDRIRKGKGGVFCSLPCHARHTHKDKVFYLPCTNGCGQTIRRTVSEIAGNVFCSPSCSATYNNRGKQRNPPKERVCVVCDLPFFISTSIGNRRKCKSCHLDFQKPYTERKQGSQPPKNRHCESCGVEYRLSQFHKSRRYCASCKKEKSPLSRYVKTEQIKRATYAQYIEMSSVKNKHPSWKAAHVRGFNRNWNKDLINLPCQVCGYSTHIELAHIRPVSAFPETATLGEINAPSNMLVLCRNHHWEFDHGHLALEDIPPRMQPATP